MDSVLILTLLTSEYVAGGGLGVSCGTRTRRKVLRGKATVCLYIFDEVTQPDFHGFG